MSSQTKKDARTKFLAAAEKKNKYEPPTRKPRTRYKMPPAIESFGEAGAQEGSNAMPRVSSAAAALRSNAMQRVLSAPAGLHSNAMPRGSGAAAGLAKLQEIEDLYEQLININPNDASESVLVREKSTQLLKILYSIISEIESIKKSLDIYMGMTMPIENYETNMTKNLEQLRRTKSSTVGGSGAGKKVKRKSTKKKKPVTKIISGKKRIIHTGNQGGKYYVLKNKKVYI